MDIFLRVSLFGCVKIEHDNGVNETKAPRITQALLAYLLLKRRLYHPRETLAGIFWGNYSEDKARSSLSTALWRLRRVLEPDGIPKGNYLLTTPSGEIGFNWESPHWLDVKVFEGGVEQILRKSVADMTLTDVQKLRAAIDLYKGDLLEEFYDDWALNERERLRQLYLDGLARLMRYYKYQENYKQSLTYGQQILQHDPLRESIHREIMKLYVENGQPVLAVRQYRLCEDILDTELNISPMEETRALYQQITARGSHKQTDSLDDITQFQQALDQLRQALDEFEQAKKTLHKAIQLVEDLRDH
jgi:DNA-binding SARP family transcriptional activator